LDIIIIVFTVVIFTAFVWTLFLVDILSWAFFPSGHYYRGRIFPFMDIFSVAVFTDCYVRRRH